MSSDSVLKRIEAQLAEIRRLMEEDRQGREKAEPSCLTFPKAADRLGVGLTKLKELVKSGQIRPVLVGEVRMIPVSEIHRISTPPAEREKVETKSRRETWVPIPVGRKR